MILLLTDRGKEVAAASGIPLRKGNAAGPLRILTESDHEIAITLVDNGDNAMTVPEKNYGKAIRLRADLIEAILPVKQDIGGKLSGQARNVQLNDRPSEPQLLLHQAPAVICGPCKTKEDDLLSH